MQDYDAYMQKLAATGNSYDVEIERKVLDENPTKKVTWAESTKIGENVYYSEYTTQILDRLGIKSYSDSNTTSDNKTILLKEGDIVTVSVTNADSTAAQTLESSFIGFSNAGEHVIKASASGMVTVNGVK